MLTEISVKRYDPESILALDGVRGVVGPGLLCTLGIDPPLEFP